MSEQQNGNQQPQIIQARMDLSISQDGQNAVFSVSDMGGLHVEQFVIPGQLIDQLLTAWVQRKRDLQTLMQSIHQSRND